MRSDAEPAPQTDLTRLDTRLMLGPQADQILMRMLQVTVLGGLAGTLYGVAQSGLQWNNAGGLVLACIALLSYLLHRRGRTALAVQVLVWCATATVLALCLAVAGVRTPALLFMPAMCMFAVWMAGPRTGAAVIAVVSLAVVGMVVAEALGWQAPALQRSALGIVLILVPSMVAALLISLGALQSFQSKIDLVLQLTRNLEQQLQALRKSEERFAAMFHANPVPSSTINRDGSLLDVNLAWEQTFGLERAQALGKTYAALGLWDDEQAMRMGAHVLQARGSIEGMQTHFRTAGGVQKPFLVFVSPVEIGGERRYVASLLDQSDRVAAEAAQQAQRESLEERVRERTAELSRTVADLSATQTELVRSEKLASLGSMVAGISHELNTPIGNTLTVATTLKESASRFVQKVQTNQLRRSELEEFMRQCAEMSELMARSTQRAAELIASFKQVSVDVSSQRRRRFELSEVVHDVLASLRPGMRHKKIELSVDIAGPIDCDGLPGAVEQVLTNLVQNAVLHGFAERETGRIRISAHSDGERVTLSVEDDGAGMAPDVLQRAFDPFFTTRMGQGGSGLGLSVSHNLAVSALRGSLQAESSPGQGTRVSLGFPRVLD